VKEQKFSGMKEKIALFRSLKRNKRIKRVDKPELSIKKKNKKVFSTFSKTVMLMTINLMN